MNCKDCSNSYSTWYWISYNGQKMRLPRCPLCHERQVQISLKVSQENEFGTTSHGQRVSGKFVNGVFKYRELY
jgi:NAD-dependent SIR2 family protein deacetylase